ncbi:hypothetical protein [Lachnobacterium bovis]|uniref:hypothetical protein n=1 Tax=Lachnobacterium bovis TaxID=140626 RepID=UPI00048638BC|nr:hypothetical protein [Lachnobacterium bovis]
MIERICPHCQVPMPGEKCINPECRRKTIITTTIYWCKECNVPLFNKECAYCQGGKETDLIDDKENCSEHGTKYIATDIRPVFPEERLLLALILGFPPYF